MTRGVCKTTGPAPSSRKHSISLTAFLPGPPADRAAARTSVWGAKRGSQRGRTSVDVGGCLRTETVWGSGRLRTSADVCGRCATAVQVGGRRSNPISSTEISTTSSPLPELRLLGREQGPAAAVLRRQLRQHNPASRARLNGLSLNHVCRRRSASRATAERTVDNAASRPALEVSPTGTRVDLAQSAELCRAPKHGRPRTSANVYGQRPLECRTSMDIHGRLWTFVTCFAGRGSSVRIRSGSTEIPGTSRAREGYDGSAGSQSRSHRDKRYAGLSTF